MYIRRTKTRSTVNGESYYSHRLVRSDRVGSKVRQRTLLNLGRHFEVEQEYWQPLCVRLDQLLNGQPDLLPLELPDSVEEQAQRILARLVVSEASLSAPNQSSVNRPSGGDIQSVDVDSLELVQPRSVGVEHIGLWAMEQLGFERLLEDVGLNGPQRAAAMGLIIGRMAAPGSELATHRWLKQTSALGELISCDYTSMSLMQLYRSSDYLMRHRDSIEKVLFNRVADLFGLACTVTLYDLTNTYFEGAATTNPKAQRGRSKEKRSDCPLLTLGLILDGSGFVRRSEVFPGNAFEGHTLQGMLQALRAPRGALVVLDSGIATNKNLNWMQEQGIPISGGKSQQRAGV